MFKLDEQISSPRLVLKLQGCEVLHKIMNSQGSRIEKNAHAQRVQMEKKKVWLQTRLGGEICLSDVIMHKGHSLNTS